MKKAIVVFAVSGLGGLLLSASASDAGVIPFGWILCAVILSLGCLLMSWMLRKKLRRDVLRMNASGRGGKVVVFIPDEQTADLADVACR